jgi:hypothetical protein
VSALLFNAFRALGPGATRSEVAAVAKALRESGDEEALALFQPPGGEYFDREACDAVAGIAEQAGAGGFVALDLYTEVIRPGWSPFPNSVKYKTEEGANQ